ncbi:MAG: nitroreductase family protein [Gaiellaceae bacterium]
MDFRDLLTQRRMVRHYDPEPIPREIIERIVRTVRRAPSGGFSQGQRLVVVTDAGTRARIATLLHEDEWIAQGREAWLSVAPVHIVVCAREQDYHDRYNEADKLAATGGVEVEWPAPFWFVDAGAAMMLLLLAAIDEGLAAAVYGVTVSEMVEFKTLLDIPDDVSVVAGVTLGHARPDPNATRASSRTTQRRRSLDEVVRWERW